ncbi:hypothetical protein LAZ67_22000457, partial [Cordylochernes scorpioides]
MDCNFSPTTKIEPLTGTNYPIWALKVGALLRGKKLFKCVISDPEPDIKDEVAWQIWSEKNDEAFGIIVTTLSDEQARMFLDETKAKKVWDELKKIYTGNLEDKIIDIGLELKNIKMKNNESINEYMARAQNIASQSSSLGHQISQRELAFHIVRGIHPRLEKIAVVLRTRRELTLDEIRQSLREEENRINSKMNGSHSDENEQAYRSKDRRNHYQQNRQKECFVCHKKGHLAKDCWFKNKRTQEQHGKRNANSNTNYNKQNFRNNANTVSSKPAEQTFNTSTDRVFENSSNNYSQIQTWCLDSGCTTHLSPHLDWMENVMPYESEINLAEEGKVTHATAKGDIKVSTCTENGIENVQIKGVLHVPNLRSNLLSIYELTNKGNTVIFNRDGAKIYNEQDDLIAEAQIQDRMYVMETRSRDEYSEKTENVMTTKDDFSNYNISLWHRRLNHLNEAYMKEIIQRNVVLGFNVNFKNLPECEACIMGKLTRQPYHPVTTNCTTKTLELVHMDLCGPMPYQSLGYSLKRKAYRVYDIITKKIEEVRSVKFVENEKGIDYAKNLQEDTNYDHFAYKKEEEYDIEIDHRTRPETSELNEETIPTLDEPNEERIVRSGRKKGDTQKVLEEKHRAKLREEEMKLLEQGVRRSQRIKERNNVNFILEPEESIPENYEEAINCENKYEWLEAMKEELYSIDKHKVWTLVQREKNMKIINCKWIFSIKSTPSEGVYRRKASLVAIGCNQKYGVEYEESFSSVIRKESLRAIVALAAQLNLVITSYDVKTAYLYGELKETIFMKQPKGFVEKGEEDKVCKLLKTGTDKTFNEKLASEIGRFVTLKEKGENEPFIGIEIKKTEYGFDLSQVHYIDKILKKFALEECNIVKTPGDRDQSFDECQDSKPVDRTLYQEMIGSLMYLATGTRPDISFNMLLIERGLWECVINEETIDADEDQRKYEKTKIKQEKALATNALSISTEQQIHVIDCKTASEAWTTLEQIFEPKSRARILQLKKQFVNIKFIEEEDMINYLSRLKTCSDHLREAGCEVKDEDLAYSMLAGLPDFYDGIIMNFGNMTDDEFTSSKVRQVLLMEHGRRKTRKEDLSKAVLQVNKHQNNSSTDSRRKCYRCGKIGHIATNCRGMKQTTTWNRDNQHYQRKVNKSDNFLAALNLTSDEDSWLLDSGATNHVCRNKDWFVDLREVSSDPIMTASGTTEAKGYGHIFLQTSIHNESIEIKLNNVLYVPNVRRNLLSVSKIEENCNRVTFRNMVARVFNPENRIIAEATNVNGLYIVKGKTLHSSKTAFNSERDHFQNNSLRTWHQRLCHIDSNAIEKMAREELVIGLEISSRDKGLCDDCCIAKSTKASHKNLGNIRSKQTLELIHTDICGPMPVKSTGGNRYFLSFVDDFSRRITLYLLKNKDEVLKHFDIYRATVERQTGNKIKVLRSDNGLEFCNRDFQNKLQKLGIKHERTNVYSPQMNGVAERVNQTLLDMARACLHSANLPQRFWAEAVNTAAYIKNKCYNSALKDKVSDGLWLERNPSVRHLKAFNCLAYSHIPRERRRKLDHRACRCILVGYSTQTRGYRLWCPESQKVIETEHVRFDESKIGLEWTKIVEETEPERYNHVWLEPETNHDNDLENELPSNLDSVGVEDTLPQPSTSKNIVRNPYGRKGKPRVELNFLDVTEPQSFEEAVQSPEAMYWRKAMEDELRVLQERGTWELSTLPPGKKPISSRWVYTVKTNESGNVERFKARLVARGFSQTQGIDFQETYAPVINLALIKVLITLSLNMKWYNRHLDVDNAYLYGDLGEEKERMKAIPYRELIRSLLYLANCTRLDLMFSVTRLTQFASNPGRRHWQAAKHVLRYLHGSLNLSSVYRRTDSNDVRAYSDADWASDIDDRRSNSGIAITIGHSLVIWKTSKQ